MVGIEAGDVQRVAVAEAGGEQAAAVIVHDHRVVDDLIASVAVHVGNAEGVTPMPA